MTLVAPQKTCPQLVVSPIGSSRVLPAKVIRKNAGELLHICRGHLVSHHIMDAPKKGFLVLSLTTFGGFHTWVPQNGLFIMEILFKRMILGIPHLWKPPFGMATHQNIPLRSAPKVVKYGMIPAAGPPYSNPTLGMVPAYGINGPAKSDILFSLKPSGFFHNFEPYPR